MRDGVVADFTVAENLMLVDTESRGLLALRVPAPPRDPPHCQELVDAFDVRTPGLDTPARNLSGGNIQKLILARELSGQPRVLLVAQPTRGIDVGAARYIHERLVDAARHAAPPCLIISEDLDEVMAISDRILVMYEGAIIGSADRARAARAKRSG